MSMIVSGNFAIKAEADSAIEALLGSGIGAGHICSFAINPAGQHDSYPIGGDEDASSGATEAGPSALKGAAIGSAIGLGAGVAAFPIAGPVGLAAGAGVGAYIGSLAGALNGMGEDTSGDTLPARPAGVLVAVDAPMPAQRAAAADVLRQGGARNVEEAEGTWRDGQWTDFNPVREQPATEKPKR